MQIYMLQVDKCFEDYAIDECVFISKTMEGIEKEKHKFIDKWTKDLQDDVKRYKQHLASCKLDTNSYSYNWYTNRIRNAEKLIKSGFDDRFTVTIVDWDKDSVLKVADYSFSC